MDKEDQISELQTLPEVEKEPKNEKPKSEENTEEFKPEKTVVKETESEGNPFGDSG